VDDPAVGMPASATAPAGAGRVGRSFLRGVLAAGPAVLTLVGARLVTGQPGVLEAVADGVTGYLPDVIVEAGISALGALGKSLLYLGVAAGSVLAGGLFAVLAERGVLRRGTLAGGALVAAGAWAATEVLVLPLFRAGFFAADIGRGDLAFHLPIAIGSAAYGLFLVGLRAPRADADTAPPPPAADSPPHLPRRAFLARVLALIGAGSLAGAASALAVQVGSVVKPGVPGSSGAGGTPDPAGFGPTAAETPVEDFYQVNKDLFAPSVDGEDWRLRVDGLVDRPHDFTLAELRELPSQEAYRTLECISFEIVRGDDLIGNQRWRGVKVADLLERVGVQPTASWVLWEAADGYTESLPLEVARHEETWIAYEMGGAPLTVDHGYPARVFISGRFGMKQPKWVTRMQLADHDEPGYWEQRGWDDQAVVKVMSRIDHPRPSATVPVGQPFFVYGIAYSGDRGIARVEISPDDGASWLAAELESIAAPPLGPLTWVRWRVPVTITQAGPRRLVVRATDGDGTTQDERERSPLPAGSTGWHAVRVLATDQAA
jgi:DMSO/TMAO reductase YedYZ molybdopterin-dependent catalytic subunit